jgi:two-component system phosphate regulon sensor histidine kinase PhoR
LARDYRTETFCDGSALLERLATGDVPDVVVLDWVMPGISGVEVCRFLRDSEARHGLAILLLTAHRHTEQIVEGLSAGANDYLAKPYEDEELRARVSALIRSKALLERAEQAEAAHRKLLETAPDPLLVVDAAGRLTFLNARALQMFGTVPTLGRSLADLVPELSAAHIPPVPGESVLPTADVTVAERRFSPLLTAGQGSTTISLRDVTERRLLEERRLDFYSIIAHDLRSPLAAMTLRLALLGNHGADLDEKAKRDVALLQDRLRSLVSMINDFLELARLEGVSYRLQRTEVDIKPLIDQVVEEYQPLMERGAVTWHGTSDREGGAPASVLGDARRLMQVFGNLISNAIKFTPAGGNVRAAIERAPRHIEVSIHDTGSGVDQAAIARLFERYTRAEHSVGGTGLGLLIVREIVEAHGGIVGVESKIGHGSRFWVRLPSRIATQ